MKYAKIGSNVPDYDVPNYLEKDKVYKISGCNEFGFYIDAGQLYICSDKLYSVERESSHLCGGDWELFEELPDPANKKDTNPKDAVGMKKVPMSVVSGPVMLSVGLAMLEGARKYGRHNYRVSGVRASVYYDAAMRHLMAWWEGEDTDPDSGLSHIIKAIASLMVLADADMSEKVIDDRPPKCNDGWIKELNIKAEEVIERYPDALEAYTEVGEKDV